jgi:hypothetical protein
MYRTSSFLLILAGVWACVPVGGAPVAPPPASTQAADTGPVTDPPFESVGFARAVERGTRTRTGVPGAGYWQQHAEYRLDAVLDPGARRLRGSGTIRYHNRSPDTLATLAIHLYQNLHRPGAARNREVPVTAGMRLHSVAVGGRALKPVRRGDRRAGYSVAGTVATVRLPAALAPGASVELELHWSFAVPGPGAPRMGQDGDVYFLGYWYPQVAVYDDVSGWHTDPYLGTAEFHMGFADYDVAITVPHGWLVAATGSLDNPGDVLEHEVAERLGRARRGPGVVQVVGAHERGPGAATRRSADGRLTWRFSAKHVRDFAWGASDRYVWDATHALVEGPRGAGSVDTVLIHSLYRPGTAAWNQSARYGRHSVEFLSRLLWPYPWPHMTSMEGLIGGGMEFPMITLIGGGRDSVSLYSVTVHEIAHMWFPMQAASDEKRHAWLDEGLTRYHQALAMRQFFRGSDRISVSRNAYAGLAGTGLEVEMMRHGDLYPPGTSAFVVASYDKPAVVFFALRALIGAEALERAIREFGLRWQYRHPQPWDLWNTVEEVAGRDLGWFWRSWFFETWTMDHAVHSVRTIGDATAITVEDRGRVPMPARLAVTRADGSVERLEIPVEVWLTGARRYTLSTAAAPPITRVELDVDHEFPDVDRANDLWVR